MPSHIYRRFALAGGALVAVLAIGTFGYCLIGGKQVPVVDALYMTLITITTIGFGEIVDLSGNPLGRIFTIFIALSGIGTVSYILTSVTALMVEGELTESFRRKKMEKMARNANEHYIVCGIGEVGSHIAAELHTTGRPCVIVELNKKKLENTLEMFPNAVFLEGDATDNAILLKAGIQKATGLFAVTGDDNHNLVITLTARQLNPRVRIVTRCNEVKNTEKMQRVGADAVVSPTYIGGLRMASVMVRPAVVSFLDIMLRDKEKNLRVEEATVPVSFAERSVSALNLKNHPNLLLLAIRIKEDWLYNPPDNFIVKPEYTLVVMTTPEGKQELYTILSAER